MKAETAAAIAKKIGMTTEYWPGVSTNSGALQWQDGAISVPLDELDYYITTGDRPLRVMLACTMGVCPSAHAWVAATVEASAEGDTPAAAILACAEALEEGNES